MERSRTRGSKVRGDETAIGETGGKLEGTVFCEPSEGMLRGERD